MLISVNGKDCAQKTVEFCNTQLVLSQNEIIITNYEGLCVGVKEMLQGRKGQMSWVWETR